jgi:hypothetical protein
LGWDLLIDHGNDSEIDLQWTRTVIEQNDNDYTIAETLQTPYGDVTRKTRHFYNSMPWQIEYPLKSPDDLQKFQWYMERKGEKLTAQNLVDIKNARTVLNDQGLLQTWISTNLENSNWINREDLIYWMMDIPDRIKEVNRTIVDANLKIIDQCLAAGMESFAFGIPGTELLSPAVFREFFLEDAKTISRHIHDRGAFLYLHMCGKISALADDIRHIEPDIFETFARKPEGDIDNPKIIWDKFPASTCFKGNISINQLVNGDTQDIKREIDTLVDQLGTTRGVILSSSDGLMFEAKTENVRFLQEYGKSLT